MLVFVTGGTGFLGGFLVRMLRGQGHDVTALARPSADTTRLSQTGATLVPGDVTKDGAWQEAAAEADAVVHAAASVDLGSRDHKRMHEVNVEGTRRVLSACTGGPQRIVHVSSIAALGDPRPGQDEADETSELQPPYATLYAETKHAADLLAGQAAQDGLPVVRVNPSVILGPGDPKTGRVLEAFLRRRIPVLPRMPGVASYTHVEDVSQGILLALKRGRPGHRYGLTQANWTHERMLQELSNASGVPAPGAWLPLGLVKGLARVPQVWDRLRGRRPRLAASAIATLERIHAFSSRKAREELGWNPVDFSQRLRETVHWYQEALATRA